MLKHYAKHVLWLLALGTVVAHAAEVPVSSNYPVSQQQVHEQLHTAIEQAKDVRDKYQLEKARTWLSYADHEYSEKAKRQNIDLIYQQVLEIVYADQRATLSVETAMLAFSQLMRRDLWTRATTIKTQTGFQCAYKELAQAEVNLVWAAAEYRELGWHHSREIFASAERLMDQATYLSENCGTL